MQSNEIRVIEPADADRTMATLTLAFAEDPIFRWIWPDAELYLRSFPPFLRAFSGPALEHGTAHGCTASEGVALWLPPGVESDSQALGEIMNASIDESRRPDIFTLFGQVGAHRVEHAPEGHWYLASIGVDPMHRGKGMGSDLLRHALAPCDAQGIVAYLESSNAANVSLYERHGFEVLAELQVGASPILRPMIRQPR